MSDETDSSGLVAIVGMSARFPGAGNLEELWDNLVCGVDSVGGRARSAQPPVSTTEPSAPLDASLQWAAMFDAAFFAITPREAAVMDPQHRLFLEKAWEALEDAGHDPSVRDCSVGVWAGMDNSPYFARNILPRRDVIAQSGFLQASMGNRRDYLTTRVSYKLGLTGPSVNVYAGNATSLVAVAEAFAALLCRRCDIALAGGVSVTMQGGSGHPSGDCRPFDADAVGAPLADGLGVVVLKRLEDAQAAHNHIYAVIRGIAVTNNGRDSAALATNSRPGLVEAIALAHAMAGVSAESISFVEGSGTATLLADAAEVSTLSQAFGADTKKEGFCAIGSITANIGHLSAASGIAGLAKASLALSHRAIPPSINYTKANPNIDFVHSPFFVNTDARVWPDGPSPRRAAVNSFGTEMGGTNVHVVLEQAPPMAPPSHTHTDHLLVLSAKTPAALELARMRLAAYLRKNPQVDLGDVALTLQQGRCEFDHRLALTCTTPAEGAEILDGHSRARLLAGHKGKPTTRVAFLFPGQGSQRVGMAGQLYATERRFAKEFDACAEAFKPPLGLDIRELVFARSSADKEAELRLAETAFTQPILFSIELALARLWMSWGFKPAAMIGHSLGEYTAAHLAGIWSLDDAAVVVAGRGRLMQAQPRGSMMAVHLSVDQLQRWLQPAVVVAAMNAPVLTVVSGPTADIDALQAGLAQADVECKRLATSHAFHSPMMDGALEQFHALLQSVRWNLPNCSWISCVSGDWISPDQAMAPEYWVRQLREPVRFSDGIQRLSQDPTMCFLEVGPGQALTSLVRAHPDRPNQKMPAIAALGRETRDDTQAMLNALGGLWTAGLTPTWSALYVSDDRRRIPLPTYPFERRRHWIDPVRSDDLAQQPSEKPVNDSLSDCPVPQSIDSDATSTSNQGHPGGTLSVPEQLRNLLANASGITPGDLDSGQTFLELGFDSLLLTQVTAALRNRLSVRVTLRQLLEELTTFETLVGYVQTQLDNTDKSTATQQDAATTSTGKTAPTGAPPIPGARLGRDANGKPAWFVVDPDRPGKYLQVRTND